MSHSHKSRHRNKGYYVYFCHKFVDNCCVHHCRLAKSIAAATLLIDRLEDMCATFTSQLGTVTPLSCSVCSLTCPSNEATCTAGTRVNPTGFYHEFPLPAFFFFKRRHTHNIYFAAVYYLDFCFFFANLYKATMSFKLVPARMIWPSASFRVTSWPCRNFATDEASTVLYESPMGGIVTRLRAVSVLSAFTGSVGLPAFCAIRGIPDVEVGILAFGMTFVAGSMVSTAAIHFVFSPYVYKIEKIPVRKCHHKKKAGDATDEINSMAPPTEMKESDCLLKAVSRSLFLTSVETVFDPETDVIPYKGLHPLCNFVAKGKQLYVHPEYVHNATLRKQLQLVDPNRVEEHKKENPDDFF